MTTTSMNFKMDLNTKKEFNQIAKELGMTSSSLLNIFVTRVVREKGLPFDLKVVPDKQNYNLDTESRAAMLKEISISKGEVKDTDNEVKDLDSYFKSLGI